MAKVKFTILLPQSYNDGTEVPLTVLDAMCEEIMDIADGWSLAGTVLGAYRMKDGT